MATRKMFEAASPEREVIIVAGNGTGASAADLTGVVGRGISAITHQATGTYRIELENSYPALLSAMGTVEHATGDFIVVIDAVDLSAATPYVQVRTMAESATDMADTDLTTSEKLYVTLIFRNAGSV